MQTNIGLLIEAARTMDSEVLKKLGLIVSLDFDPVKERMLADFPDYSGEALREMELEVKRFLALALFEPKAGHRIVVSEKIDTLWHYFILHTHVYHRFCADVYGAYLHHIPILPAQKAELGPDYLKTRQLYERYFGPPPSHLWGDSQQICWGGCDEAPAARDTKSAELATV